MSVERYGILIPVCDGKMYNSIDALTKEENEISKAIIYGIENKEKLKQASIQRKEDFKLENRVNEWIALIES